MNKSNTKMCRRSGNFGGSGSSGSRSISGNNKRSVLVVSGGGRSYWLWW